MTDPGRPVDRELVVRRMDRLLGRLARRKGVRHVVMGMEPLDGSWSWADAAGRARLDGSPMGPGTPWLVASITKVHIAVLVLKLHEQGAIDLDAPIERHLPPELRSGLHVLDGEDHTGLLTPLHLLGHRSGLPDSLDERPRGGLSLVEEVLEADRAWSLEDAVLRARDRLRPHFAPARPEGRRRYSDTNYQLLMIIARQVTGRTIGALYRELIFEPLGLRHTWLPGEAPLEATEEPAEVWLGDQVLDRPLALSSFMDLYSTVDDLLSFGRAVFSGSVFDDPDTARLMWSRFHRFGFPRGMAALRAPSWPIEYGLGMMRFDLPRWLSSGMRIPAVMGHTGSSGSWLWYCPSLALLLTGTVDQTRGAAVPFRAVPRALAGLGG